MSREIDGTADPLPAAAARRLSNQIGRAFRGTYGAKTGLRTIVRSVTRQMLASGASGDVIAHRLELCILNHPARVPGDPSNTRTSELDVRAIVDLTRQCVAEVALEGLSSPRASS